ncbi:glutamine-rich protein 2-like isoform X1 [Vidua chalybeata]|uniref:glutamine-rich protein 2-like isoform X1 n=1 Tax=Vidua chalybeata TaxID=81927 RepID=UPI0023A7D4BD|nr:glutamine-rich protein 2-like isoform X1 [Vidua chalybeata]
MATSLDTLSLSQMLDLAIGMPQKGAIHFAALRKLLQAVLEHLDVQYLSSQEPWPGQLSGPSLADLATDMGKMKREMEDYKKHMSKLLREEIAGIKAENSRISEDMRKIQETQTMAISQHQEEIAKLKAAHRHTAEEMKKVQMSRDEDTTLIRDLREEIDKIKTTQICMEGDIKKIKESLALMKKLEEDLKKLRQDAAKWKEESSKEISQQIEALRQETKRDLQKMGEQQEMRNAMLEQLVTETADQLNEQDRELSQHMEAKFLQIQRDYEKLSFASGMLQKDSQQKQKEITMLFQSLEKLQKEKANVQDMMAAMDMKADKAALGSKVDCSQFEENMEELDERMQELQSQISDQEQHWNEVQRQFSDAIEEKLDRLELKTFRKHLEDSWSRNMEELENRLMRENAAGIKKQLPVPFTCLSCDRMLTVQVPGQSPKTLPYLQPLPPSKEPQHSQRRPVAHGSVPGVPPSSGDHQSSSFKLPPTQGSLRNKAFLQGLVTLPNKALPPHGITGQALPPDTSPGHRSSSSHSSPVRLQQRSSSRAGLGTQCSTRDIFSADRKGCDNCCQRNNFSFYSVNKKTFRKTGRAFSHGH